MGLGYLYNYNSSFTCIIYKDGQRLDGFWLICIIAIHHTVPFRFFWFSFLPTTHMYSILLFLCVFYVIPRVQHTSCNGLTAIAHAVIIRF